MNNRIKVYVKDDGPGVSKAKFPELFKMFSDISDDTNESSTSGFGLGLAISKSMIESVYGDIKLERSDSGATFSFTVLENIPRISPTNLSVVQEKEINNSKQLLLDHPFSVHDISTKQQF